MENGPFRDDFPNKTSIYNGFFILSQHPPVGSGGSENTATTKDIRKSSSQPEHRSRVSLQSRMGRDTQLWQFVSTGQCVI